VQAGLLLSEEGTGRLNDVVDAGIPPGNFGGVRLVEDADLVAVDDQVLFQAGREGREGEREGRVS
jgi:hypothetical protein